MKKRNAKELIVRYLILLLGMFVMSLGVGFSIKGGLGTLPFATLPYAISRCTPLTVGVATTMMHCVYILMQIALLRKQYQPVQLLQLPVALVFGYITDLGVMATQGLPTGSYALSWLWCLIGIFLMGVGVALEVMANVVTLASEGMILAFCKVTHIRFGNMKVIVDICVISSACLLSLLTVGGLESVREGTVASALLIGQVASRVSPLLKKAFPRYYTEY